MFESHEVTRKLLGSNPYESFYHIEQVRTKKNRIEGEARRVKIQRRAKSSSSHACFVYCLSCLGR